MAKRKILINILLIIFSFSFLIFIKDSVDFNKISIFFREGVNHVLPSIFLIFSHFVFGGIRFFIIYLKFHGDADLQCFKSYSFVGALSLVLGNVLSLSITSDFLRLFFLKKTCDALVSLKIVAADRFYSLFGAVIVFGFLYFYDGKSVIIAASVAFTVVLLACYLMGASAIILSICASMLLWLAILNVLSLGGGNLVSIKCSSVYFFGTVVPFGFFGFGPREALVLLSEYAGTSCPLDLSVAVGIFVYACSLTIFIIFGGLWFGEYWLRSRNSRV